MKKAEKNDEDFGAMKRQYESAYLDQMNAMKKLLKERELLHVYIQRLIGENALLSSRSNQDQAIQLLTRSSQIPHSIEVFSFSSFSSIFVILGSKKTHRTIT